MLFCFWQNDVSLIGSIVNPELVCHTVDGSFEIRRENQLIW